MPANLLYLCGMLRIIIIGIIVYVLYKFVVKFLLPLAKLVSMTHRSINEVKQNMQKRAAPKNEKVGQRRPTAVEGEYIDYEEVR